MRRIEKEMLLAIARREPMKQDNTQVVIGDNSAAVRLHASVIAEVVWSPEPRLWLTLARWSTRTTFSRLNAVLHAAFRRAFEVEPPKLSDGRPLRFAFTQHKGKPVLSAWAPEEPDGRPKSARVRLYAWEWYEFKELADLARQAMEG